MSDMSEAKDETFKGGVAVGFVLAAFLFALPAILFVGWQKETAGFQRGAAHGRCDADCRWIHNKGRWDGVVYGEFDDETDECKCIRVLDGAAP